MGRNKYTDIDVRVAKDAGSETYDAWLGSDRIGTLAYQSAGGRVAMISIAVEPEYQHRGVAGELIAGALDDVADSGRTVTIICPVVRSFIDEHPEYTRLIDANRPGIRSRPVR
jgi:predicted GNAT family acetyltransferase